MVVRKHTPNGTGHCPHTSAPKTPRGVTAADPGEEGHKRGTRTQRKITLGRRRDPGQGRGERERRTAWKGWQATVKMQSQASGTADHSQTHTRSLTTRGLRSTTETPFGIRGRRLAPDDTRTPCGGARGSAGDSRSWPTGPLRHKPPVHRAGSDPRRGHRAARTDKIDSLWPTGPPRTHEGTSGTVGKHHHGIKPPHTRAILTPFPAWDANRPLSTTTEPPHGTRTLTTVGPKAKPATPPTPGPHARDLSTIRNPVLPRDRHTPRSGDSRVPTQPEPDNHGDATRVSPRSPAATPSTVFTCPHDPDANRTTENGGGSPMGLKGPSGANSRTTTASHTSGQRSRTTNPRCQRARLRPTPLWRRDGKPHHRRGRLTRTVRSQQREVVATATGAHSRERTCKQTGARPPLPLSPHHTRVGHRRTAPVAAPRSRDSQADTRQVKNTGPSRRLNREQDRLARSTVDRTPPQASRPDLQRRFARGQLIPNNPVVQNHNSQ
ncbi:hypothetical protein P7K49_039417 [Saguinus oedipus]|uniref:Uncharacterized protein n=1 Tax=Saguinus oedipus TaxID=9490 RepID=A0ABQ9TDA9_SAGOE|nr:hypothetical protein P7K49_039417 [Saguinus oedipus]